MPRLIRLYIQQVLLGFALSAVFVAALMVFNIANLRHLVGASDVGLMAVIVLWVLNGIVFAGVQFGISIMRMAGDDRDGGGRRDATPELVPSSVPAEATKGPRSLRAFGRG